jgi:hypothetical protein
LAQLIRFGTEKLKISKHKHVTPRWMQNLHQNYKKIISGHFDHFGRKIDERVKKAPK